MPITKKGDGNELAHVLRKDKYDITRIALRWTSAEGKRKRGRPKETWQHTIESKLRIMGMTW